jgi:hypothetical protein
LYSLDYTSVSPGLEYVKAMIDTCPPQAREAREWLVWQI